MYYLITQYNIGQLVREFDKYDLAKVINEQAKTGFPYRFIKKLEDMALYCEDGRALLINGDIVVPREKRVVIEYEVE